MRKIHWLSILFVVCLSLPAIALKPSVVLGNFEDTLDGWVLENGATGTFSTFGATLDAKSIELNYPGDWKSVLKKGIAGFAADLATSDKITLDITWRSDGGQIKGGWFQVWMVINSAGTGWYQKEGTGLGAIPTSPRTDTVSFEITQAVRDAFADGEGWADLLIITNCDKATGSGTVWIDNIQIPGDPIPLDIAHEPAPEDQADIIPINLDLNGDTVVDGLSWKGPESEPNMTILSYKVYLDPNQTKVAQGLSEVDVTSLDNDNNAANTIWIPKSNLAFKTTYYWRVDSIVKYDYNTDPNTRTGSVWSFTTIGAAPMVDAGSNIVTSLDLLPAMIAGTITDANNDLETIEWTLLTDDAVYPGTPAVKESMQMLNRNAYTADPTYTNLLQDWTGTDTRSKGDPLKLTISGLPSGIYTWTSYHHDTQDQTGQFDVTITDATGTKTISNVDISNGAAVSFADIAKITATIESDGSSILLVFDQRPYNNVTANAFFVMNGFDLVKDAESLKVDFGSTAPSPLQDGYQAYSATHEVADTFTPQSFAAFNTTVTVNLDWGIATALAASVANTTTNLYAPDATFTTDTIGTYKVRLTGTDKDKSPGTDLMEIRVYVDACSAAKANPNGYTKPQFDFDNNCIENLNDFSLFASKWLEDASLSGQASFTSIVTYTPITVPQP